MTTAAVRSGGSFRAVYAAALSGLPLRLHGLGAAPRVLPVHSWGGTVDPSDRVVLAHCTGPTLDVGCGPGRMAEHLAHRGVEVLGIDVLAEAVRRTRSRGACAVQRDVFAPVPAEGGWDTALLADGNIGIGGDPARLLRRVRQLLAPGGRVVVDLARPGAGLRSFIATVEHAGRHSDPFPWAVLGAEAVTGLARTTGFAVQLLTHVEGRWYAVLRGWR